MLIYGESVGKREKEIERYREREREREGPVDPFPNESSFEIKE
jgi:hypothetical protein